MLLQARRCQLIEVARVKVDHPCCRGRWWLQGDHVVSLLITQKLPPPITQADVKARIVHSVVITGEQRRRCQYLRQQFGNHRMLQA
ncbi:hypothetical protein D3C80_1466340 [compost metagenome]